MRFAWLVIVGCAHAPAAPVAPAMKAPPPPVASATPVSPWAAVPVRVMTWTSHGIQQIGQLPGQGSSALPQPMPEHWYVEPIARLDEATFGRLVELVRSEHVPGLSLRNQVIARWLGRLQELPELGALVLDSSDVDGAALGAMQLSLTRLYLARTAIDDAALAQVAERQPGLEVLDVEDTAIGDRGARAIAGLAQLHAVNLAGTQITDEGGAALGALARLEIADLGTTRAGAKTVAALRKLPLHELFLDRTSVRGEVATLAPLAPALVRFDIADTSHHPTDAELGWLARAPNLVEVSLSGAKVHDPLTLTLARLPGLREIRLANTAITVATVRVLAARSDLEEVDLAGAPVDNASAAALLAAPEMRIVRLDDTPIDDTALASSTGAGPQLAELYLSRTSIGDRGLAFLDGAPHLTALGLGHTAIGDAGLARVARLADLRTLVLSAAGVRADALTALGALHALERLYLDETAADDDVLEALAPAHDTLRVLHLAGSAVSDNGIAALRALRELRELTVGDTRMHTAIADLSGWPRLRTLALVGLPFTDAELPTLAAHAALVWLDLTATDVRDPSALAALPRLRTLGLQQVKLSPAGVAAAKRLAARGVDVKQ
jgi:hypothetical protein